MKSFSGVSTALLTPFIEGRVDFKGLETVIDDQLKNGIHGFVVNGTTAESPTLSESERGELLKFVKEKVRGKAHVIMGTGSHSTQKTIEESQIAEKLGAEAVLVVVPYYNKPPQRGLVEHFKKVADHISVPLILYNVPSRTITSLSLESIIELSQHPRIIGIKEASGDMAFAKKILENCGKEFLLLSGDDPTFIQFLELGGHGTISVVSHVVPKKMVEWFYIFKAQENTKSISLRADFEKYLKLIQLLFCEANPIPLKKAMQLLDFIKSAELRLPLVELQSSFELELQGELRRVGFLK